MYTIVIDGNNHGQFRSAVEAVTYALAWINPMCVDWDWKQLGENCDVEGSIDTE